MTAALKPSVQSLVPAQRFPPRSPKRAEMPSLAASTTTGKRARQHSEPQLTLIPSINNQNLKRLPSSQSAPLWFNLLVGLQRGSSVVTFLLIAAVLVVYGWTVYSQQLWSQEYRKLENLQRQERQLTAKNEILKNQLAQQAERPEAGLVPHTPKDTIFLEPAPQRPETALSPTVTELNLSSNVPLGY